MGDAVAGPSHMETILHLIIYHALYMPVALTCPFIGKKREVVIKIPIPMKY